MYGIETLSEPAGSAATIGFVLLEAVVLYVGYGGLTRALGGRIRRAVTAGARR